MCSADQIDIVSLVEFFNDILAEQVTSSSWGSCVASSVVLRVRPHEVAHWSIMRYFLFSIDSFDLIKSSDSGRKTSVDAEYLVVNDGGKCKVVEDFSAVSPDID
jgi:hypothetical protein